ncbi:TLC domain-containing protein [Pseudomassariella vexata]|uniref:TLC domain-domain-containing protein n=1 Tax=Pseudomassariella vexata TaxID=1141098 RepID=A0A1Y2E931_9PEZI|nr:TLC domain-containing protein [Pseudomassariella vexata]ORY67786.1 TLC domain-domain-containing protein [Pseudomassariella vexata]
MEQPAPPSPPAVAVEEPPQADKASEKPKGPSKPPMPQRKSTGPTSMNGPLYMQTINNKIIIRRLKRKGDGPLKNLARWLVDNQTGFSFNLIALLFLTHFCMSKARPYTSKFFTLSHYNPNTGKYAAGRDDLCFIAFCIILFTGLRAGFMENILAPLAKIWGISKRKEITRFSEQAWLLIYYTVFWTLGLYIYCKSPYFLNMTELWTNWPVRELDGLVKGYVLAQWAFWLQQVLVINIEDRRKDHWQMLTHHFITIALISSSYAYHQTRVGNLILVLMDVVDLFLPLAKCLKYLGFTTICDVLFGLFMVSWFFARHVFYLMTCWSVYADIPRIIPSACFSGDMENLQGPFPVPNDWSHLLEPFREPSGTVCWNTNIKWGFLGCLVFLQVLTIMWFVVIVQVAMRVLRGKGADDVRSDDEGEEDEEEEFEYEEAQPLEEEVGVEALDLKGWERRKGVERTSHANASGVSLPGHSDRKELLGRIGCEKQVD